MHHRRPATFRSRLSLTGLSGAASAQAASVQAASVQAASVQVASVQAVPVQAASVQAVPVQAASVRAVLVQAAPVQVPGTQESVRALGIRAALDSVVAVCRPHRWKCRPRRR